MRQIQRRACKRSGREVRTRVSHDMHHAFANVTACTGGRRAGNSCQCSPWFSVIHTPPVVDPNTCACRGSHRHPRTSQHGGAPRRAHPPRSRADSDAARTRRRAPRRREYRRLRARPRPSACPTIRAASATTPERARPWPSVSPYTEKPEVTPLDRHTHIHGSTIRQERASHQLPAFRLRRSHRHNKISPPKTMISGISAANARITNAELSAMVCPKSWTA